MNQPPEDNKPGALLEDLENLQEFLQDDDERGTNIKSDSGTGETRDLDASGSTDHASVGDTSASEQAEPALPPSFPDAPNQSEEIQGDLLAGLDDQDPFPVLDDALADDAPDAQAEVGAQLPDFLNKEDLHPLAPSTPVAGTPAELDIDSEDISDAADSYHPAAGAYDSAAGASDTLPYADELPLLEERVDPEGGFSDQTMQQLLGEAWQDAADDLLNEARETIGAHSTQWQPQDTDELNKALKVRIDATVRAWLADVLKAHIHVLHEQIVAELADELKTQINNKIKSS